jgi:quinol monooxygenase YgiN
MAVQSIVATLKAKSGQESEFESAAGKLVAAVRANEPGCLLYALNRTETAGTYVFMERYADEESLKAHRGTEHFKTLGRAMGAFMDGPPVVQRMVEVA